MPNLNKVFLMGNLTKDPELKYTPSGKAVATLRMAVNRSYVLQSGEKKDEVLFIGVVVWGKTAENCNLYLKKGSPLFVEGRMQSRSWETPDGQKKSVIEVVADRVQFLSARKSENTEKEGEGEALAPEAEAEAEAKDDMPPF